MSTTSILPMRVAVQNRHRKQAGHRFRIEMRAGDGTSRNTLCGPAFPLIDNLPANPSAVSAPSHAGGGKLRTAFERTQHPIARAVRSFSRGQRLITNLAGYLSRWSFLRAFVQHPQKSDGRFFVGFQFSPSSRSSVAHESNNGRRTRRDVGAVRQGQGSE